VSDDAPELRTPTASKNAKVSVTRIRLDSWRSVRPFKEIICGAVSEFESYMVGHVRLARIRDTPKSCRKLFKGHRDSSYQSSNRVHFLFMTAIVPQDAGPCWRPGNFSDSQPYVSDMAILLEIKTAFGPEDTAAMTAAFEETLKRLNVADHEAPIATSVAKKIVRLAKRGERNPTRLTEGVISSFRATPIPM